MRYTHKKTNIAVTEKRKAMNKRYFIAEWEVDQVNPDYFPSFIKINNGKLTLLSELKKEEVQEIWQKGEDDETNKY